MTWLFRKQFHSVTFGKAISNDTILQERERRREKIEPFEEEEKRLKQVMRLGNA